MLKPYMHAATHVTASKPYILVLDIHCEASQPRDAVRACQLHGLDCLYSRQG